jgi:hypothetical protein
MIVKALLNLFFSLINGLLSLFPTIDIPSLSDAVNGISYIADMIGRANMFVPVDTIFTIISISVCMPLFKLAFFFVNWVIRRIVDLLP